MNVGSPAKPCVPVASLRCSWVRVKRCLQLLGQHSWVASWKAKMVLRSSGLAFLFLLLDLQQCKFTDAVLTGVTLFLPLTLQLLGSWQSCHALWPAGGARTGDLCSARRVTSGCDTLQSKKRLTLTWNYLVKKILSWRRIIALPFAGEKKCREDRREEHQVKTIIMRTNGEEKAPTRGQQGRGILTSKKSVPKEWMKTAVKLKRW